MAARKPREHDLGREWTLTGLLIVAVGIALSGLRSVLQGFEWWIVAMVVTIVILGTSAVIRSLVRHRVWGLLGGALAAVAIMTLIFSPGEALLGIVPTPESIATLRELEAAGADSIAGQGMPAEADQGITYLVCLGVAALVFSIDLFASGARMPVLTGLSLLVILLVPSFVDADLSDPLTFVLTAATYLGILLVGGRTGVLRPAAAVGAGALAAALVLPLALPAVQAQSLGGQGGGSSILNPIITLGNDLRRGDPSIAYTYTTTLDGGDYFRMTALDDFAGPSWAPSTRPQDGDSLDSLGGGAPGLADEVPTTGVTTEVVMGDVRTRWLPVPYAPQSVTGLEGTWRVNPDGLVIGTGGDDARGQEYAVQSLLIQPTVEQLQAAGSTVPPGFERYLDVPTTLPEVVAETADQIAGDAPSNYEAAVALQAYFLGGEFTYSEQAPVDQGYDGSGAGVLAEFLDVKAGYCVHFSSAMAAMARTLGIPARVAVGFTAGTPVLQEGETVYRVTTHEFHAWPELYFENVGWVRFEPTPGRGNVPSFPLATEDDPATPDVDESVPPPASTTPTTPVDPQQPEGLDEEAAPQRDRGGVEVAAPSGPPVAWIVLWSLVALALAPAVVRILRRETRMAGVRDGSAAAAWAELRDTVHDLGSPTTTTLTPRQFADELQERLDDEAGAAVDRLATALEHEAYAPHPAPADPRDVRRVRRALARRAGLGARILAVLVPRSLFAAWLPQVAEVEA